MAIFSLTSEIREIVKAIMEERPLDMMIGPPTMGKMDDITEKLVKCITGVRSNATKWANWKIRIGDLIIATNNLLTPKDRLPKPANVHVYITDETRQKDLLRLTKDHDTIWAAYHVQESATEIGVSMLVANVEAQYLVKLDDQYVCFPNQTPLSILAHLTKTWVKVQNHEMVASTDAFKFLWGYHPAMHVKTYTVELNKSQRAMKKLKVPCDDALKVITYVDNMHKSGIFKERELLCWENTPVLQGRMETQDFLTPSVPTARHSTSDLKGCVPTRERWPCPPPERSNNTTKRQCTSFTHWSVRMQHSRTSWTPPQSTQLPLLPPTRHPPKSSPPPPPPAVTTH